MRVLFLAMPFILFFSTGSAGQHRRPSVNLSALALDGVYLGDSVTKVVKRLGAPAAKYKVDSYFLYKFGTTQSDGTRLSVLFYNDRVAEVKWGITLSFKDQVIRKGDYISSLTSLLRMKPLGNDGSTYRYADSARHALYVHTDNESRIVWVSIAH